MLAPISYHTLISLIAHVQRKDATCTEERTHAHAHAHAHACVQASKQASAPNPISFV